MDVSQYLEIFLDETKEHLQNLNTQILELEKDSENMDTINEIFRAAHSLKGMAGTMGYKRMQNLTHDMENVFSEVRNGTIKVKANLIDILFQCLDALEEYTGNIQETADEGDNDNAALIDRLNAVLKGSENGGNQAVAGGTAAPAKEAAPQKDEASEIALTEEQKHVLREAKKAGKNVYSFDVKVQDSCILKAARAFLVFKSLEEVGEIIVSQPSAQDIEDERFDTEFSLVVISDSTMDVVSKVIERVSEIERVYSRVVDRKSVV